MAEDNEEKGLAPPALPQPPVQDTVIVNAQAKVIVSESNQALSIQKEKWVKTYWRPAMAWLYMIINLFDFVIFPALSMILPGIMKIAYIPWKPLTLDNGGLIHLAFGAILGITSWVKSKERIVNGTTGEENS